MVGQVLNASFTGQAGDGQEPDEPDASDALVNPPKVPAEIASQVFKVPESLQDRPPCTVRPPSVPMFSTPLRKGTLVPAEAVEYSQFSDTYRAVPVELE